MIIPFRWHWRQEPEERAIVAHALKIDESEVTDEMWEAFCGIETDWMANCTYDTDTHEIYVGNLIPWDGVSN